MALKTESKAILSSFAALFVLVIVFYDFAPERALEKEIQTLYSVHDPQFLRSMDNLLGPGIRDGNRTETLLNGVDVFPSMLEAIRSAKKSVTFETYIYWSGKVGKEFSDALSAKAQEGLKVHVLLDFVGSGKMDKKLLKQMVDAGVEVVRYNPVHWINLAKNNNRTHRKILVVDGKVGFTGGVGVADQWLGNADSPDHWRDTQFRLEGPAVGQMQAVFMDNWLESKGVLLHGDAYFPKLEPAGSEYAQVFKSSPREDSESARLMYLLSIASAHKSILMSNAYFVPDDLSIKHFVSAARRGVKIQIITPGAITDTKFVRYGSRACWGDLLKAGIEIFEYQPTMYHVKAMVVDEIWSSVGSTNFDNRSFRLNDEVNLNIFDADFAREQMKVFADDLKESHRVSYEEWKNRPRKEKIQEWLASLLRHQL